MAPRPVVTMIAGPNGSGKTTLTKQLVAAGIELGLYINADEIDASLPGPAGEERSRRAQALADETRGHCLQQGVSFAFETVMSHPSKVDVLREARRLGYAVVVFYVALETPRLNVERVRQRVALGGHPVPEDRIESRYRRSLALLPQAISQADRSVLFDNSYRLSADGRIVLAPVCEIRRALRAGSLGYARLNGIGGPLKEHLLPHWVRAVLAALRSVPPAP